MFRPWGPTHTRAPLWSWQQHKSLLLCSQRFVSRRCPFCGAAAVHVSVRICGCFSHTTVVVVGHFPAEVSSALLPLPPACLPTGAVQQQVLFFSCCSSTRSAVPFNPSIHIHTSAPDALPRAFAWTVLHLGTELVCRLARPRVSASCAGLTNTPDSCSLWCASLVSSLVGCGNLLLWAVVTAALDSVACGLL